MRALRLPLPLLAPAVAGALAAIAALPVAPGAGAEAAAVPAAVAAVLVTALAAACPWTVLPLATAGGTLAAEQLGLSSVTEVTTVHAGLLALGLAGVGLRRAFCRAEPPRVRTAADLPMLVLAAALPVGAAYGLARGNPDHAVAIALYQLGVVPVYFFAATLTLTTRRRLIAATALFAAAATALAMVSLATPGRHGGLLSALALPVALAAALRTGGTARGLLLALAGLLGIDVVLAAYRSVWLAAGIALTVLLLRGAPEIRRAAGAALLAGAVLAAASLVLLPGFDDRSGGLSEQLRSPLGYRLPESAVGSHAFLAAPLAGQGLGQVAPDQGLPGLGLADVGPVYHAFYVTVLANAGIVGVLLVLWPLGVALRSGGRDRSVPATSARALLWGFLAAAAFAAPTDGHWELGLLAALALLPAALARREPRT